MSRSLAELARALPDALVTGEASIPIADIQYDSRLVSPDSLFVALRGGYADGHDFICSAIERGAAAVVVDRPIALPVPSILVSDTRSALSGIAAEFFEHPTRQLDVVGITGTDGKTTTSHLVDVILSRAGRRTGVIGTVTVKIADQVVQHETRQTTPESLEIQRLTRQMVEAGVEVAIIESTSHGLAQHRLDDVAFDIGAVTNITHEHLEFHRSIAAYRAAKATLFDRVSARGGTAVVNLDDEGARDVLPHTAGAHVLTYSCRDKGAAIFASDIRIGISGTTFGVSFAGERIAFASPLIGQFNVENALAATGISLAVGLDLTTIASGLANAPEIPGRMERVDEGQPFTVIVDYAHTPESLKKLLTLLRELSPSSRIIAVSGSAGERDVPKRALQGAVSARMADFSIFTNEDPRFEDAATIIDNIAEGARGAGARSGKEFLIIVERKDAIAEAIARARPGDIVLLAGKGHERSIIWNGEKIPWDESAVAADALRAAGYERAC